MTVIEKKVEAIKKDWASDPITDIEHCIGTDKDLLPFKEQLLKFEKEKKEEWKQKWEQKKIKASENLAKGLYGLRLGESFQNYTRVPGGWIYEVIHEYGNEYEGFKEQMTITFIPFSSEF